MTQERVPEPFVFYDSPAYRLVLFSHGQSPRGALTQKDKGTVVEFQDGDVCRLIADMECQQTGNPWEDMVLVDSYLTVFDFQSSGMLQ